MIQSLLVDLFCIGTGIGIWPRFIEPKMVSITHLSLPLNPGLKGLKIVHLTDLHFHKGTSPRFLDKVRRRIIRQRPDIIVFTGDFICYSRLEEQERLKEFLTALEAPMGCYCTFGNHDYASYVSRNRFGNYDVARAATPISGLMKGFTLMFKGKFKEANITEGARRVPLHEELTSLLKETPFKLLENACVTLPVGLNICGLGDYGLGRCRPETAFAGYDKNLPGIILSHNPDSLPLLRDYPGELILSGHTHGEQIHFPLPGLRKISYRLAGLENPRYTRGLFSLEGEKKLYVNRGIGCHKPLRFCSPPEICVITAS